ncbi:RAMP superfamily CRISPR-associated protein [Desulfolucanica intricata]|uniref:RAMP superfamily CRISPR-associated protein n=1 Tax=Desulfolucanica intricata TaxID=1285191 RepID=UPI0008322B49|nr:RAMP superfamily CRISPR-associated protein [Desulfolucanica intricata]
MYNLKYRIRTLSPVIITRSGEDTGMTETIDYIPGSAVLGIFASHYIKLCGLSTKNKNAHEDDTFYNWFLRSRLIFNNAFLSINDGVEEINLFPTPLSIQTDKSNKKIINLAVEETSDKTKPVGSYSRIIGNLITIHSPEKYLHFHHYKVDRLRRQDTETGIFNYESLSEGQVFTGTICGDQNTLEEFKKLFGNKLKVKLGRSKNTQYGEVEVELLSINKNNEELDLSNNEVILTFISPVILVNRFGYPEVSLKILQSYLEESLGHNNFKIEKCFARMENTENFISVWKLKKPQAKAISIGSTYKIIFDKMIDNSTKEKLLELAEIGFGERKNEGFGRLLINWATKENYHKSSNPYRIKVPDGQPPKIITEIFSSVAKNNIEKVVENEAVKEARLILKNYLCKLTTSTLGRLELMLQEAENVNVFALQVEKNLRETAKDKLKECRLEQETLWEVIIEKRKPDLNRIFLNLSENVKVISQKSGFNYINNDPFHEELYKKYWFTFFRTVRKLLKEGGQ